MVDVAVIGAGPTGLMLACELASAGVRPVVLERYADPRTLPKANGLVGQIVELLAHRGLVERFSAASRYVGPLGSFPFGSMAPDFGRLSPNPLRAMLLPQPDLERLLAERAAELGVEILRDREVTGLVQDPSGVTLEVRGEERVARYVVGCDGAHSRVRGWAGIGFPGTTDAHLVTLGHVVLPDSILVPGVPGALDLPGFGRVQGVPGTNRTPLGSVSVASFQPRVHIVAVREERDGPGDDGSPTTVEELQAAFRRVLGAELPIERPIWLSRTVGQSRLADRYRAGRVFVAGDAAHVFSAGGSALNVGLLDAVNLGWKLAAEIGGWAPPGLLDTYDTERRAVGARAQAQTRAQSALAEGGEDHEALRALLAELLQDEAPLRRLAERLHGSDVRYAVPPGAVGPQDELGAFVAELPVRGPSPLARVRGVLVDPDGAFAEVAAPWEDRVDRVGGDRAVLVRPDAHLVWAAPSDGPPDRGLREALLRWFGAP